MEIFKFYYGLFILVHVRIRQVNFDDMDCTWNAGHVIGMSSLTSRGKPCTYEKWDKMVMKSAIV